MSYRRVRDNVKPEFLRLKPAMVVFDMGQEKIEQLAHECDDIIRKNPTTGVKKEISKKSGKNRGIRKALTTEQQRIFMEYIAGHPIFYHWWPLFTVLLGTGCRIGEAISLRWDDLDFENRVISVNHGIVYYRSL